jgi:hypothetical protein
MKAQVAGVLASLALHSLPDLLHSAQRVYPLLVIHEERVRPHEATIGQIVGSTATGFRLRYIDTSAVLRARTEFHRYSAVTKVGFGGEYEETLAAVARLSPIP